jgi:hypothetical protein
MSGESKKRRAWIGKTVIVLAFFCVNLLAAYLPAVLFIRGILSSIIPSPMEAFLGSPVAFACRVFEESWRPRSYHDAGYSVERFLQAEHELHMIERGFIVAFLLLLFAASAALCNLRRAWVVMPTIVIIYSLFQGLIAALIEGLNAIP